MKNLFLSTSFILLNLFCSEAMEDQEAKLQNERLNHKRLYSEAFSEEKDNEKQSENKKFCPELTPFQQAEKIMAEAESLIALSLSLYEEAAYQGDKEASFTLYKIYQNGQRVNKDVLKAQHFFRLAAAQNHPEVLYETANNYHRGLGGLPKDLNEAVKMYKLAANQGHIHALTILADLYDNDDEIGEDYAEAARLREILAEKGDMDALFFLGWHYYNGEGVAQDYRKAAEYYQAHYLRGGSGESDQGLSIMYASGQGVAQDAAKAAQLSKK